MSANAGLAREKLLQPLENLGDGNMERLRDGPQASDRQVPFTPFNRDHVGSMDAALVGE